MQSTARPTLGLLALSATLALSAAVVSAPRPALAQSAQAKAAYDEGIRFKQAKDHKAAAGAFERALQLDGRYAAAWTELGNSRLALGQTDSAIEAFQSALAIDPNDQTARYNVVLGSLGLGLHGPPENSGHSPRDWGVNFGDITETKLEAVGNIVAHSPNGRRAVSQNCLDIPACADGHIVYAWGNDPDSPGPFPDPDRDIAAYMTSIGETATLEAFLAEARQQSKANWRPAYTAGAVNAWVREGFGVQMP